MFPFQHIKGQGASTGFLQQKTNMKTGIQGGILT